MAKNGTEKVGENVEFSISSGILTITVDLKKKGRPSASGKTTVVASTLGNVELPCKGSIKMGINIYKK